MKPTATNKNHDDEPRVVHPLIRFTSAGHLIRLFVHHS